jgi:DNA helicase-2/ATP-dependent DNA helicase PcrA
MPRPRAGAGAAPRGSTRRDGAGLQAYEEVKTELAGSSTSRTSCSSPLGILADREDIARTVRGQYRHFVVDEYQDVNALQQRLLEAVARGARDLCVVGDPDQTIYSFTGATPRTCSTSGVRHPRARRCAWSATTGPRRRWSRWPIVARRATGATPGPGAEPGPAPTLTAYPDDPAEAGAVAAEIAALIASGGTSAREVAMLFRTNAQSQAYEAALATVGVPYLVRGGERFFARREVRDAVLLLRGAARGDDGSTPLPELVREVIAATGWTPEPTGSGAVRERWESVRALVGLAEDLVAAIPQARMPDLVRDLDERAAAQHAPAVDGVTLASLHAAKGLEWDVVYVVGCSDGFIPVTMAEGSEAIAEERRLLYVGITRARRRLRLTWAAARTPGAAPSRRPSRFLDGASAILGEGARSTPKRRDRGGSVAGRTAVVRTCSGCGTVLTSAAQRKVGRCQTCPATYDEATFEALRAWRSEVARSQKVPAYVVFTDATLTAIAERRPATSGALAEVSGVGARKLAAYGPAVLSVLAGDDPDAAAAAVSR